MTDELSTLVLISTLLNIMFLVTATCFYLAYTEKRDKFKLDLRQRYGKFQIQVSQLLMSNNNKLNEIMTKEEMIHNAVDALRSAYKLSNNRAKAIAGSAYSLAEKMSAQMKADLLSEWIEADKQLPVVLPGMGASQVVIILCDDGALPSYAQYFDRTYQKGWYYLSGKKVPLHKKVTHWRKIRYDLIPDNTKGDTK